LKFFAKAVGEADEIYFDEGAARAAGHPAIPAPPTFGFSLRLARPDPFAYLEDLGIDMGRVLHGNQKFEYLAQIYAGDEITLTEEIVDVYEKKGGALKFIVWTTVATNQHGVCVLVMWHTAIVRS
jgi:acyl dehydratase